MPNHCMNLVDITGKDKQKLLRFVASKQNPFDFEKILPCPKELRAGPAPFCRREDETEAAAEKRRKGYVEEHGFDNWYDWCLARWGSKWSSYAHRKNAACDFHFYTAWSPPEALYRHLSKQFAVQILVVAVDEGDFFCSRILFRDGRIIREEELQGGERAHYQKRFDYY